MTFYAGNFCYSALKLEIKKTVEYFFSERSNHMNTLKELTHEIHYENYRSYLVRRISHSLLSSNARLTNEGKEFLKRRESIEEVRRLLEEKNERVRQ